MGAMVTTNEALKKALNYSLNQRKYLETFLEEGDVPISNNDCEACIRPFATGIRSWLFADSPEGAKASEILYTLVETAKLNGLDVYQYLKYLLEVMPETDFYKNLSLASLPANILATENLYGHMRYKYVQPPV